MTYPFCKEWGVDANEFTGLCSQVFKPKTGTNECSVCVTPGIPTGTCNEQQAGNCIGVRFPYRVSFEIPTLTEPFENGELSDTFSESYTSGIYNWTYANTMHWKSVPATSISEMTTLTVPGYDPAKGNNQGSTCYWENYKRFTQHLRIDLLNYNFGSIIPNTSCPCEPFTSCYDPRYHIESIQKINLPFGSPSPFTDCGQPATYTTPCHPEAKIKCRPGSTTSGLAGQYFAKWTLELSHSKVTNKTTARLFLRRQFTCYLEQLGTGYPWQYIGNTPRIQGEYRIFLFPQNTRSSFFAKAPTKYGGGYVKPYGFDGFPWVGGTPPNPGVPLGSVKYGEWIADAIGMWVCEDVCRTTRFSTWKMDRVYQTYDEYPEFSINNLPPVINVKINAG